MCFFKMQIFLAFKHRWGAQRYYLKPHFLPVRLQRGSYLTLLPNLPPSSSRTTVSVLSGCQENHFSSLTERWDTTRCPIAVQLKLALNSVSVHVDFIPWLSVKGPNAGPDLRSDGHRKRLSEDNSVVKTPSHITSTIANRRDAYPYCRPLGESTTSSKNFRELREQLFFSVHSI